VRKKTEREDERDGTAGTHDTSAHRKPEGTECLNYDELHQGIPARMAEAAVPSSGGSSSGEND
jgi:hypothetical protein